MFSSRSFLELFKHIWYFQEIPKHELDHCRSTTQNFWTVNIPSTSSTQHHPSRISESSLIEERLPYLILSFRWSLFKRDHLVFNHGGNLLPVEHKWKIIVNVNFSDSSEWQPPWLEGGCRGEAPWVRPRCLSSLQSPMTLHDSWFQLSDPPISCLQN